MISLNTHKTLTRSLLDGQLAVAVAAFTKSVYDSSSLSFEMVSSLRFAWREADSGWSGGRGIPNGIQSNVYCIGSGASLISPAKL